MQIVDRDQTIKRMIPLKAVMNLIDKAEKGKIYYCRYALQIDHHSCRPSAVGKIPSNQAQHQQRMAAKWLQWYFTNFIAPLLRANFYVTESEVYRYRIFYYRQVFLLNGSLVPKVLKIFELITKDSKKKKLQQAQHSLECR